MFSKKVGSSKTHMASSVYCSPHFSDFPNLKKIVVDRQSVYYCIISNSMLQLQTSAVKWKKRTRRSAHEQICISMTVPLEKRLRLSEGRAETGGKIIRIHNFGIV